MFISMLSKRKLFKVIIRYTLCSGYLGSSWKCSVGTHMMVIYNSIIPYRTKCSGIEVNFLFLAIQDFTSCITKLGLNHRCLIPEFRNVEEYIKKNLVTDKFTVVIHGEDDGAKLCSL